MNRRLAITGLLSSLLPIRYCSSQPVVTLQSDTGLLLKKGYGMPGKLVSTLSNGSVCGCGLSFFSQSMPPPAPKTNESVVIEIEEPHRHGLVF